MSESTWCFSNLTGMDKLYFFITYKNYVRLIQAVCDRVRNTPRVENNFSILKSVVNETSTRFLFQFAI